MLEEAGLLGLLPPLDVNGFEAAMSLDWSDGAHRRIRDHVATEADGELALRLGWLLRPGVDVAALAGLRWPRKLAQRAVLVANAVEGNEQARQLVRWKCGAAFALCVLAANGVDVEAYLAMLERRTRLRRLPN